MFPCLSALNIEVYRSTFFLVTRRLNRTETKKLEQEDEYESDVKYKWSQVWVKIMG